MCFTAGLVLQAFAVASHACHVHLGSKPGQGQTPATVPCLRSAQTPALPSNNSVPLPQLEVRRGWTHISALGLPCWLCLTLFVRVSFMHLAWYLLLCQGSWQSTEACIHIYTRKLKPCTSAQQSSAKIGFVNSRAHCTCIPLHAVLFMAGDGSVPGHSSCGA